MNALKKFSKLGAGALIATAALQAQTSWIQQSPSSTPPTRFGHSMEWDGQKVVLFGGLSESPGNLNDTWTWDGSQWTLQSPPISPLARHFQAMAYDFGRNQVVMFGGVSQDQSRHSVRHVDLERRYLGERHADDRDSGQ
jgi:hypothetical protein